MLVNQENGWRNMIITNGKLFILFPKRLKNSKDTDIFDNSCTYLIRPCYNLYFDSTQFPSVACHLHFNELP